MRGWLLCIAVFLACGLASGQVTVIAGHASNMPVAVDIYSGPFVPLVTTPSISLDSPPLPATPFAQPVWHGSLAATTNANPANEGASEESGFRFGAARFESSYGAAQLAKGARVNPKEARLYTNQNIAELNQNLGTVKFGSKTEHLD
jgi:hypothetical protein